MPRIAHRHAPHLKVSDLVNGLQSTQGEMSRRQFGRYRLPFAKLVRRFICPAPKTGKR